LVNKTPHGSVTACIDALRYEIGSLRERLKAAERDLQKALQDHRRE
jgi:hypothetical protein